MPSLYTGSDFFLYENTPPAWRALFEMAEFELILASAREDNNAKRIVRTARQVVYSGTYLDRSFWETRFREPVITHAVESPWIESWDVPRDKAPWSVLYVPEEIKVACALSGSVWSPSPEMWRSRGQFVSMYRKWARKLMNRTPWPCSLSRLREIRSVPEWPSLEVYREFRRDACQPRASRADAMLTRPHRTEPNRTKALQTKPNQAFFKRKIKMSKYYRYKGIIYELITNPFTGKLMLDASCGCADWEEIKDEVESATEEEFIRQEVRCE